MAFPKRITYLTGLLSAFHGTQAAWNLGSTSNIAVYWGQNSVGQATSQQRLSTYCSNSDVDVFMISFILMYDGTGGVPELNLANAGDNCTTFPGTALYDCPQIADDIQTCQSLGKTILLSTGGSAYTEGGFSSSSAATASADQIWEMFGPVTSSSVDRPFGNAVVDGFDFDFEAGVSNMQFFANQLRSHFAKDTSKTYYLTAAPQCPYPDASDNGMLDGAVYFDAIWVQFYNNYCQLTSYTPGSSTQNNFDFETWDTWAHNTSLNPNVKVYLGVPGGPTGAGSGYETPANLVPIINYVKAFSSFGGAMVWDASQAWANSGFISGLASDLA